MKKSKLYWYNYEKTIKDHLRQCTICNLAISQHKSPTIYTTIRSHERLERVVVDLVELDFKSEQNLKQYLLRAVDHYSRKA